MYVETMLNEPLAKLLNHKHCNDTKSTDTNINRWPFCILRWYKRHSNIKKEMLAHIILHYPDPNELQQHAQLIPHRRIREKGA